MCVSTVHLNESVQLKQQCECSEAASIHQADQGQSVRGWRREGWMQQVSQGEFETWHQQQRGVETAWNKNTQVTCQHIHKIDISTDRSAFNRLWKMSGIAQKLQHNREKSHGIGTNSHAVKYLNQDFESLRQCCLERGRLFEDECFEALPSSLGFNELGPDSYKVRGITWKRPTVEWTVISAECADTPRSSFIKATFPIIYR